MHSSLPTTFGRTTVILGAGATRGSDLTGGPDMPSPPLDIDFLTQAQLVKGIHHQKHITNLIKYCHQEFGPDWSLRMEQLFNHTHYAQHDVILPPTSKSTKSPNINPYRQTLARLIDDLPIKPSSAITSFKQCLLATLCESLFGRHSQDCRLVTCKYHDSIAKNLEINDTVITFNYDCLIDSSMLKKCDYWDPSLSYLSPIIDDSSCNYWKQKKTKTTKEFVPLLKLHGSINWQRRGDYIKLTQRPYTRQNGDRHFYIIPPVHNKDDEIFKGPLQIPWSYAIGSLSLSETIIIVGYSCPDLDPLAKSIFYKSAQLLSKSKDNKFLRNLIIADPSQTTRARLRNIFKLAIGPETRIHSFDNLESFANKCFKN